MKFVSSQSSSSFLKGFNLSSTHSIDQIDIRIDNLSNACIPFNFTDTSLSCLLSRSALDNLTNSEPNVEVGLHQFTEKNHL